MAGIFSFAACFDMLGQAIQPVRNTPGMEATRPAARSLRG